MKRPGVTPARRCTGLPGGRLLVLFAVLAGLFAMHGMSSQVTMSHSPAAGNVMDGAGEPGASAELAAGGRVDESVPATTVAASVSDLMVTMGMGGLGDTGAGQVLSTGERHAGMGVCLAVLAGAVLLALRRAGALSYPLTSVLTTHTVRQPLPPLARDPDPPDLYALSVQRC